MQNARLSELSSIERELLELIIVLPRVAHVALEQVCLEWLDSDPARQILDAYQQLWFSGQSLELDDVLKAIDDPLKELVATLAEQARAKNPYSQIYTPFRLQILTSRMCEIHEQRARSQKIAELQAKGLAEQEEQDILQTVIRESLRRQ